MSGAGKDLGLMAPKRRRMMDMILALGGLKEESVIPASRVSGEIENLRIEIAPLAEELLAFPDAYFQEMLVALEKSDIISDIGDKTILSEAVEKLEKAIALASSEGLVGLLELLKPALEKLQPSEKAEEAQIAADMASILEPLSEIIANIETAIEEFERTSEQEAEAASSELSALVDGIAEAASTIDEDPNASLELLQKLGTKTRYGPFLRTTAQVKRGVREGRIDDARFRNLLSGNILMEINRGVIMFILSKMGSRTITQMAGLTNVSAKDLQRAIVSMIQRGEVEMIGLDDDAPVFSRVLESIPNTTLVLKRILQQIRGLSKSLEGNLRNSVIETLDKMGELLSRLQKLGQYDETALAEPMKSLGLIADSATEAALSAQTEDSSEDLKLLVSAGLEAFARFRLKIALEKGPSLVSGTNVYGEKLDPEFYEAMMSNYLDSELERGTILVLIRELGAMTAKDLADRTPIPQDRILQHLLRLKRDELLTLAGESHGYILYDVPRTPSESELTLQTAGTLALQLAESGTELKEILEDLKPQDIGRLAGAFEAISKARDRLEKITVDGAIVGEAILRNVEESAKSAVMLTYRTRARLPSTRPKVALDELTDVDVPSVLEEYRSQMGYAPLLGFGTINWEISKCLGCKSCEISCPEDAIKLQPKIEIPKFFEISDESMKQLPVNRALLYSTVRNLAVSRPSRDIILEKEAPGFGSVEVDLWLCVACRTCVRRCPGPEDGALELELRWSLPEVVRQITTKN